MSIIIGSARVDENGKFTYGKAGDQKQVAAEDYKGEVSLQTFYMHKKGWYCFRPISSEHANKIARAMYDACNNKNIGYSQNERSRIWTDGIRSTVPTNADCSSLVRQVIKESTGKDVGNFNTTSEPTVLSKSGLFEKSFTVSSVSELKDGDILVTKTQGHTVVVVSGSPRSLVSKDTYPKYTGSSQSIVDSLKSVGENDTSLAHRKKIAQANGISIENNVTMNKLLLKRLKEGSLVKA